MRLSKEPAPSDLEAALQSEHASRMESWSKFISEAYWNAELENVIVARPVAATGRDTTGVFSWERSQPPKLVDSVRITALLLMPTWLD